MYSFFNRHVVGWRKIPSNQFRGKIFSLIYSPLPKSICQNVYFPFFGCSQRLGFWPICQNITQI